jgi:hypothetical protein
MSFWILLILLFITIFILKCHWLQFCFINKICLHLCFKKFIKCISLDHIGYENFENYIIHFEKIVKEKGFYFDNLVNCLYSLDLKFVAQVQITCARNNNARKDVKFFISIMRKSKVLQLGLQLGFWVAAQIYNSWYLYKLEFYRTSCNGHEYNSTCNN